MPKTVASPMPTSTQLVSGETRVGTRIWPLVCAMAGSGFCPQYQTLPSDCIATLSSNPAQILVQFAPLPTRTGTALLLVEPIPNGPAQLLPQAANRPLVFKPNRKQPTPAGPFLNHS